MSAAIGRWLASGHVGASSLALAAASLGATPEHAPAYPHDSADFGRCYMLWMRAPTEAKEGLARLAAISAPWKRLSERWDELLRLYKRDQYDACQKLIRELTSLGGSGLYETRKDADGRWDSFKVKS